MVFMIDALFDKIGKIPENLLLAEGFRLGCAVSFVSIVRNVSVGRRVSGFRLRSVQPSRTLNCSLFISHFSLIEGFQVSFGVNCHKKPTQRPQRFFAKSAKGLSGKSKSSERVKLLSNQ